MSHTILLVEDDRNQRLLYETELTAEGHDVIVASDGREAMEKVQQHCPDLVVMDIAMPNMDGIEALGRILAEDNQIPIILNTAYASYKDNFMSWAADAYVVKSSDMKELKRAITRTLETRCKKSDRRSPKKGEEPSDR